MWHPVCQQESQKVNSRQYYNKSFTTTLPTVSVVSRQVLGPLIIVVVIRLLSGSGWRLRGHAGLRI